MTAARDFQLVIQSKTESLADYDTAIEVENAIADRLGDLGSVDGHDAGSGEMNIFIITPDPRAAFDRIRDLLSATDLREPKVAYRAIGTDSWTMVHPAGRAQFRIK